MRKVPQSLLLPVHGTVPIEEEVRILSDTLQKLVSMIHADISEGNSTLRLFNSTISPNDLEENALALVLDSDVIRLCTKRGNNIVVLVAAESTTATIERLESDTIDTDVSEIDIPVLLQGRYLGQTIHGGTSDGEDLVLRSTIADAPGKVYIGPIDDGNYYDELNKNFVFSKPLGQDWNAGPFIIYAAGLGVRNNTGALKYKFVYNADLDTIDLEYVT